MLTFDSKWKLGWCQNPKFFHHWTDIEFWLEIKNGWFLTSTIGQTLIFDSKWKLGWHQSTTFTWCQHPTMDGHCILVRKQKCGGCQNSTLYLLKPPPLDRRWLLIWNENCVDIQKPNIRSISSSIPLDRCDLIHFFVTDDKIVEKGGVISYICIICIPPEILLFGRKCSTLSMTFIWSFLLLFFCCCCCLKKLAYTLSSVILKQISVSLYFRGS